MTPSTRVPTHARAPTQAHGRTCAQAYRHTQSHTHTHGPLQTPGGLLALSPANRELYGTCASTGYRPAAAGGGACTPVEVACYKCYCFKAINAGMIKCAHV